MKIVLVHNTYLIQGGEDVVFWQEGRLLREAGDEVIEYQRFNQEMEQYSTAQKLTLIGRTIWSRQAHQEFGKLLDLHRPDVVHVHNTFPLISPSILWACHERNVPVVHTLHNYRLLCPGANFIRDGKPCEDCTRGTLWQSVPHGCYRDSAPQTAAVALMLSVHRSKQTWTRTVDRYIALTEFARSKFVHGGLPADKIVVKPNCVDPDPGERTETIGDYALFVGRVSEEKGALTLIRAWQKLKERIPLRIMGDGPALGSLETQVAAARMDHVSFIERQSRNAVIAAMKRARFVIFPSQLYENMPLTILEAFACGVPVVASRLGAMQEMVEEEVTGAFFDPNDADDLARVVGKTWSLGKDLQVWGKQARREFERHYSAPANYRALKRIYAEAIANRRAQPQGEAEIEPVAALQ